MPDSGAVRHLRSLGVGAVSPEGERVADLLDWVFDGIYHLPNASLRGATWGAHQVGLALYAPTPRLSTYDDSLLTRLVLGAHDAAIRLSIGAAGPTHVRLLFSPRSRDGDPYHRHPTLGEHVDRLTQRYGRPFHEDRLARERAASTEALPWEPTPPPGVAVPSTAPTAPAAPAAATTSTPTRRP